MRSGPCCWVALVFSRFDQYRGQQVQGSGRTLFLTNLGHEIRMPLNGMTGLLLETDLSAEECTYTKAACESSEALFTLLEDLLTLAGAADAEQGLPGVTCPGISATGIRFSNDFVDGQRPVCSRDFSTP